MRARDTTASRLLFVCVIVFSFVPDVGIKFSTAGFYWTAYRLTVALVVADVILTSRVLRIVNQRSVSKWIVFMAFWCVYGLLLLLLGKYSDLHNGFLELLAIFSGLVVLYYLSFRLSEPEYLDLAVRIIYWLLNIMLLIGLAEIVIGRHLPGSGYNDLGSTINMSSNKHMATGMMYNMNDFSAMLTCMSPVLLDRRFGKKRIITLIGILVIDQINDATTCTLAVILFVLYYLLILTGGKSRRAFMLRLTFWVMVLLAVLVLIVCSSGLLGQEGFFGAFARQVTNALRHMGSLYKRLLIYKDAVIACLSTWGLGLGASGFSGYFLAHPSASGLTNPHSLIFEMLAEYGVVVAAVFIGLIVWMFYMANKVYISKTGEQKRRGLMVIAFIICYVVCSFASSTYIKASYPWPLMAVMCAQLDPEKNWEV